MGISLLDPLSLITFWVSVIYLMLTLVVWVRLSEPLEKFGWIIGSILAAIGILNSVIGDIPFGYRLVVGIIAVIILSATTISTRYKIVRKETVVALDERGEESE